MATPVLISTTAGSSLGITTVNVTGCVVGDVLVAIQGVDFRQLSDLVAPTGAGMSAWTQIGTGVTATNYDMRAWHATVTTAGTRSVSVSQAGGGSGNTLHVLRLSGVDPAAPIDGSPAVAAANSTASNNQAVGPVTVATPDALLVGAWGGIQFSGSNSYTPPAGMTERADTTPDVSGHGRMMTASQVLAASGATGTRTAVTALPASQSWTALLFALGGEQQLNVAPGGIATGAAFGTATVDRGTVFVEPGGIPTAEAFGTPHVAPGQGVGPPTGIPAPTLFGTPTVAPGVRAVPVPGIPAPTLFGTPGVAPGVVFIAPAGIESGAQFGQPRVEFGIAAVDLPRAYPRTEIAYPAVQYELVCVARIPELAGPPLLLQVDPVDWTGLAYADELSKPQRLDASCSISNLTDSVLQRVRNLDKFGTELWLYRNGRLIYAGPLLTYQVQGETITLQSLGLLSYLRYWTVEADLVFSQVDQHLIARSLIDHWQGSPHGHFGLDTSGITASGQVRDATYLKMEQHNIARKVEELGARQNGFDIEVDPETRKVRLWSPQQGVDRSAGQDAIIFDVRNVTSGNIICSAAPGDLASDAFGVGTGGSSAIYSTSFNADLRASFGRTSVTGTYDGVSEQSTLDAYVAGAQAARNDALLVPGPDVRTTTDADLDAYDVGDTVAYELHERLAVTGAFRIRKRTVTVSKVGREKTAVEFV